jgi:molybdate transport system substrate-binding protein
MGDPTAMAFGRTAMAICERSGMQASILKNVVVYGATVKQLALYVSQGAVDAAIIGRADAFQNRETIAVVPIPNGYFQAEVIAAAVLESAADPDLADRLGVYLSSRAAVDVFQRFGFLPLDD